MRRFFEPCDLVDRILYAFQTVFMPYTVMIAIKEGLLFPGIFCAAWWVLSAFYTIEWLMERLVD